MWQRHNSRKPLHGNQVTSSNSVFCNDDDDGDDDDGDGDDDDNDDDVDDDDACVN